MQNLLFYGVLYVLINTNYVELAHVHNLPVLFY